MTKESTKEKLRKRRQRERLRSTLIWAVLGSSTLIVIGILIWPSVRPAVGDAVPVMPSSNHIATGEDPGPLNTDPPTSGPHYSTPLEAGFYDEIAAIDVGPYPEGHLLHNLEHGHVIFWYNCDLLDEAGCNDLIEQIQGVLDDAGNTKVIAFPWTSIDVPVVVTSWGRMQRFENFDPKLALRFVKGNRNRAPEPLAP